MSWTVGHPASLKELLGGMGSAPHRPPPQHLELVLESKLKCAPRSLDSHSISLPTVICYFCLAAKLCSTLWDLMDCSPPGSAVHGDSPGKNTGVGCHAPIQGIFLAQESNPLSLVSPALASGFFTTSATWEAHQSSCTFGHL